MAIVSGNAYATNGHRIDSLKKVLLKTGHDTNRIRTLLVLSVALEDNFPDTALIYAREAFQLAKNLKYEWGITKAEYSIGILYDLKGNGAAALIYEDSAASMATRNGDIRQLRPIYNVIGNIYSEMSKYAKALDYYFRSLSMAKKIGDSAVADIYNNIGLVYESQGNYTKALDNYFKALEINTRTNDDHGMAVAYCNIGIIYKEEGNYAKALEYHKKALSIDSAKSRSNEISQDYSNIGDTYNSMGNFAKAVEYDYKALDMGEEFGYNGTCVINYTNIGQSFINAYTKDNSAKTFSFRHGDKNVVISRNALLDSALVYEQNAIEGNKNVGSGLNDFYAYKAIGDVYDLQKKYDFAANAFYKAYSIADSIGALPEKVSAAKALGQSYMNDKKYDKAMSYMQEALKLKDSLFNENEQKALGQQEAQFDYDKKIIEQQKEEEKQQALAAEQTKRQKLILIAVSLGLVIVLVFTFLLYKRFKIITQQKLVIEEQKKEVDRAYEKLNDTHKELRDTHLQLQEKDKDLTDSIVYAKRIQNAILPVDEYLRDALGEYFVLFKPRDVVSGDFYWCHKTGNKVIFAVADCTGHGVPGAFMSVIGNSLLNQVVIENAVTGAVEILTELRSNLLRLLQQRGQESVTRDGMDIALCIWDKANGILEYAGANNPLYLVRKGISMNTSPKVRSQTEGMAEILPDKQPIGYQEGKMETDFKSYKIELKKGDFVYIASDGYHDQFGGEKNKKFTSSEFRKLLVSVSDKSLPEQKNILNNTIEKWKGNLEQTDDICVMGIAVS